MATRPPYPLDHSTHVPVLAGIGRRFFVHNVLEYGCGNYSTPAFLNRELFPSLKKIVSVEQNPAWAFEVRRKCSDARLSIVDALYRLPRFSFFDLVFVDDESVEDRVRELRALAEAEYTGIVVVHDSESSMIQAQFKQFNNVYEFKKVIPNTAILSYWADQRFAETVKAAEHDVLI